jgi:hypothetical protein
LTGGSRRAILDLSGELQNQSLMERLIGEIKMRF